MRQALNYDDFGAPKKKLERRTRLSDTELEDLKLAAFEQGFTAGWEDAVKAHSDGNEERKDEIVEALRDAEFSLHEARRGLIASLAPLFSSIMSTVLPAAVAPSLPLHIAEQLKQMCTSVLDQKIEVEVSEEFAERLQGILDEAMCEAVHVIPSSDKSFLGARLRVGREEKEIDMQRLVEEIEQSLAAALNSFTQETSNG